jgi:hypothetical protein
VPPGASERAAALAPRALAARLTKRGTTQHAADTAPPAGYVSAPDARCSVHAPRGRGGTVRGRMWPCGGGIMWGYGANHGVTGLPISDRGKYGAAAASTMPGQHFSGSALRRSIRDLTLIHAVEKY